MVAKRRTKSHADSGAQRKTAPRLQVVTIDKLSQLRIGDRVVYRDEVGRERVGTVSSLNSVAGAVILQSPGGLRGKRVTARNFVRIEARTARNIISRTDRNEEKGA